MQIFESTFKITEVLRLLLVLEAFIGVLIALMALQLERRKEYAILRALDLTRRQVSQLILLSVPLRLRRLPDGSLRSTEKVPGSTPRLGAERRRDALHRGAV